jgi:TatD DNase family protein
VTTTPKAWSGTRKLVRNYPNVRLAVGLHPEISVGRSTELPLLEQIMETTRYVGEVGIDGGVGAGNELRKQQDLFRHILLKGEQLNGRFISIHSRRATKSVLDTISETSGCNVHVLHWFSGTRKDLGRAKELGCWYSVNLKMLQSQKGQELAFYMPRDRILLESDGPFAVIKGQPLRPVSILQAISKLAVIWSCSQEVARQQIKRNISDVLRNF